MRISKAVFFILATAIVVIFAAQPLVHAGSNLNILPVESGVKGAVKTTATFAATERTDQCSNCQLVFILRLDSRSAEFPFFTANLFIPISDGGCGDLGAKQAAVSNFLNHPDVVDAICEGCAGQYVHIKKVNDSGAIASPESAIIADFELVLNEDPPAY